MSNPLHMMCTSRLWIKFTKLHLARPVTFSYMREIHLAHTKHARSSLFISDRRGGIHSDFEFNNDFPQRIKDKTKLKRNIKLRECNIDIDKLETEYNQMCDLETRKVNLEKQRAAVAQKMSELVKKKGKTKQSPEDTNLKKALIEKGKKLKAEYKQLMAQFWEVEEHVMLKTLALPTDLMDHVTNEDYILEEKYSEKKKVLDTSHVDFINKCKNIKLSPVGDRAYYLSGPLVSLEHRLLDRFSTELRQCGFTTVLAPEMIKTPILEGGCVDVTSPDCVYRLLHKQTQQEVTDWYQDHLFLTGASHLSFLAYLAKTTIRRDQLPWKLFVVGRSYGPDSNLPGLYGATQSNKVHVCGVSDTSDGCTELLEEFKSQLLHMYNDFQLPYRFVSRSAPALSVREQNRLELQMWSPGLQQYIMVASISMCGDYSGRRLMINSSDSGTSPTAAPIYMIGKYMASMERRKTFIVNLVDHGSCIVSPENVLNPLLPRQF